MMAGLLAELTFHSDPFVPLSQLYYYHTAFIYFLAHHQPKFLVRYIMFFS